MLPPAWRSATTCANIHSCTHLRSSPADSNVHIWTCKCCLAAESKSRTLVRAYQNAKVYRLCKITRSSSAKHIINLPQSLHACIWRCKSNCNYSTKSSCVCCTSWSIPRGTPACPSPTPPATAAAAVSHPPATPADPRPHCLTDITGVRASPGAAPRQSRGSGLFCASASTRDQHYPSVSTNHCHTSCTRYSCDALPCSSAKDALPMRFVLCNAW